MKPTKEELVKKYIGLVYYFTRRWLYNSDDADDMVQETYRKALANYDAFSYHSEGQLRSWLLTIARHGITNAHKLKKPVIALKDYGEFIAENNDIEAWIEEEVKNEQINKVKQALQELDTDANDIIRLRFYEELSFNQIAEVLKISEATAKMRCYRAIHKLKTKVV